MRTSILTSGLLAILASCFCGSVPAQEAEVSVSPLDGSGKLVQFERDIAPIFRFRCLECHGAKESKGDFRVDDPETLADYIEPGDIESSALYTDYLTSADADVRMPPVSHTGPLPPAELALIRIWIEEGADWPAGFQLSTVSEQPESLAVAEDPPVAPMSVGQRVWRAIGYLHPATIHFPIALLSLGALFVVIGTRWPGVGTQIPLACLWIGTVSAIAAATMGWSLAPTKGYGEGWDWLSFQRDVDIHRWGGLTVALLATLFSVVAILSIWKGSQRLRTVWKVGLVLCGMLVGLVGHKGGEMTYGREFYPEMFRILTGGSKQTQPAVELPPVEPPAAKVSVGQPAPPDASPTET